MTDRRDLAAGTALVVFWSSGFVGAELGTRFAPADTLLAWRYVVAAVLLALFAGMRGVRLRRSALLRHGVVGLLSQCLYLGGVVTGVALGVPAGTTALVAAVQPMLVAAAAGPVLGERTTQRQWTGLGLGLAGVGLVVGGDVGVGGAPWWAFLLPVGGTAALAAGTLLERRWRPAGTPLDALTVQTVLATGVFVAVAGAAGQLEPPAEPGFWWAVAWVVVLSSFGGYGSYLLVLRRSGAVRVSTLLYLTPPATMIWMFLMFGEVPGPLVVPGGVLCAVAVALATSRSSETVGGRRHHGRRECTGGLLPRHP
jgi:drug/metabolite transporter (DMT)-like permease